MDAAHRPGLQLADFFGCAHDAVGTGAEPSAYWALPCLALDFSYCLG
jgi:hypothetical protein